MRIDGEKTGQLDLFMTYLMNIMQELTQFLMQHPEKIIKTQLSYWQDYQDLFRDLSASAKAHPDKRFKHDEWHNNIALNFIKNAYLLLSNATEKLVQEVTTQENQNIAKKLRFFFHQYLDAIAPTNFSHLNPEVLSRMEETQGESILNGFKQFLEDMKHGNIKMTDVSAFKLGENIACTPGKIVYQNDLMQLIQYTATTDKIYPNPMLIIPPWINKYYILDLQPENSFVKWLVDQGMTVFLISWVNPDAQYRDKQFSDYLRQGPLAALNTIEKITGNKKTNLLGYCIGGTLLGCLLAYLTNKQDMRIGSATFLTTLLDFSEPGDLGAFVDEDQISLLEKHMQSNGYFDGKIMASIFSALRANDLVWNSFVNNYLKGQKPKPFDLLYWNSDYTHIPEKVHRFYLRNMYLQNLLVQKNKIKMAGIPLDLTQVSVPSYFLAAQDDHIVPWRSSYKSSQYFRGKVNFVLATSGHVAGVINPPHQHKYGYWVSHKKYQSPESFLNNANFREGSWWNNWMEWQKKYAGKLQPLDSQYFQKQKTFGDAPGAYVKRQYFEKNSDDGLLFL